VTGQSSVPYPFGDVLALARQSWLGEMAGRLGALGYPGYRRSDAAALRLLLRGPVAVGQLGTMLGVTRQAARKVADGLQQRGYATTARDPRDSRRINVTLTPAGHDYADAIVAVIAALNREVERRADPAQLAAADAVLRAALFDHSTRQRASRLPHPPAPGAPAPPADSTQPG
jgi:MarR family transcriptional regulator, lower aerobic nicotinate degradation pathway regulator